MLDHSHFMARRFLRMGMRLMRNGESYVPPELRTGATLEQLQTYYLQMWPKLLEKWVKAGAAHAAFDKENPLGQWLGSECHRADPPPFQGGTAQRYSDTLAPRRKIEVSSNQSAAGGSKEPGMSPPVSSR